MKWRNLCMFFALFVLTPAWSQINGDGEVWVSGTDNWLSLKMAKQYEGTYWALGMSHLEQQLIGFDAQGTITHTFSSYDLPAFTDEFVDFYLTASSVYILCGSGQIYKGDLDEQKLVPYIKLEMEDGIRPLFGGFAGAFQEVSGKYIVQQLSRKGIETSFDPRAYQDTEWALAMYDKDGKLYRGLLKYPDILKAAAYGMTGQLGQVTLYKNAMYAYVFPDGDICRFSLEGKLLERIPVPAFAQLVDRLQKVPEALLSPQQEQSREASKARMALVNQSRNDFVSRLQVLDMNTLQYFYHAFDRDKIEYQVYHHTFHIPTGKLTKKKVYSGMYAFYFHPQKYLPITIVDRERGKGVVLRRVVE